MVATLARLPGNGEALPQERLVIIALRQPFLLS
jgi:hypothetical protein